ncbi:MAG TPA: hypothetical protein VHB45_10075 [Alloacidobacterium sp.]|nr:hypothetical protein [Alloacidobacterium sp.]
MTNLNQIVNLLFSGISIAGIVFLFAFLFSDYRLDLYRHKLFTLRDELFDLAVKTELNFDHAAYKLLNLRINSLIRYAHKAKLRFFLMIALYRAFGFKLSNDSQSGDKSLRRALEGLRRHEQFALIDLDDKLTSIVMNHVLFLDLKFDSAPAVLPKTADGSVYKNTKRRHIGHSQIAQVVESQAIKAYRTEIAGQLVG